MNCIQSVIMPVNYSCKTTVYQSFCTTIENEGIHNKLQFFLQILIIPVAIINSILHATQNKTFHENGYNRIKHCVKPMKWQDRVCLDFVCFESNTMSIICSSPWNVLKQVPVKYHHFSLCSSQFAKMIPFSLLLL